MTTLPCPVFRVRYRRFSGDISELSGTWGKAVTYTRNQWEALRRYTEDGRLTIDNNVSERTLRHQAIGRKN